ncbi:MAG: hypothetical protein ACI8QC_004533 [Planctomycetota bacterium]|jgi:hypothetical protein
MARSFAPQVPLSERLAEHQDWIVALGFVGLGLSLLGLLALPWALARLPHDYFEDARPHTPPSLGIGIRVLRNLLGALVVLAGVAMLILPGQGLLTILAGMVLMEFPGKRRLERALVARPGVLAAINWLRARAGAEPMRPVHRLPRN